MIDKPIALPRLGPRPLPFHLMTQVSTLLGSHAGLPSLRNGCAGWKPHLASTAEDLRRQIAGIDAAAFDKALEAEVLHRLSCFFQAITTYRQHPSRRDVPAVPVLWDDGTTRLLDYSRPGDDGPPVLVVPSLINRACIMDLVQRRSFMRYVAAKGLRAYLVDWDAPGPAERDFGLDQYVAGRLARLLERVLRLAGRPFVVGYCMGGLLGLALAVLHQADIRGLALLATPWDFHAPTPAQGRLLAALRAPLEQTIAACGELPVDLLQCMFGSIDPGAVDRKFRAFGRLNGRSGKACDFVALEDWINDGVPLTAAVARESLFGWYVDNLTARGEWCVAGTPILPEAFDKPALAVIPEQDRIVPPTSALALARALPKARILMVPTGHIGMMAGGRAQTDVYGPIARWLLRVGGR